MDGLVRKKGMRGPGMEENRKGEVCWLTFEGLTRTGLVKHGFSTRLGGVSEGEFASMNLGFGRGDEEANVRTNFSRMADALETRMEDMVLSRQTHTTNVRVVEREDRGTGITKPFSYDDVDGLVTNEPGIMLVTFHADCTPIYLVDVVQRAIGLCHSGWRGTVGQISREALRVMGERYGTKPQDVVAAVGPSICQDCYEVDDVVMKEFERRFSREQVDSFVVRKPNGKYQLDLWEANRLTLVEAGVREENVYVTDTCTCCNAKLLFSHRASGGRRGNLAAFLALK